MRRRVTALVTALVALWLGAATPALALLVWTLTPTVVTATAGQQTSVTMTATNLDLLADLGCFEVILPSSFTGVSATTPVASNGDPWRATVSGTTVVVRSLSGGGRLDNGKAEFVSFVLTTTPTAAGAFTWSNHAHQRQDCKGANEVGVPVAVTVVPVLLATPRPTPIPTPRPTPEPTPDPTPTVLPDVTPIPVPLPVETPRVILPPVPPGPPAGSPPPDRSANATPAPSAGSVSVARPLSVPPVDGDEAPGESAGSLPAASEAAAIRPAVAVGEADNPTLELGAVDVMASVEVYAVPAAAIAVPGIVLLIWLGLQTIGALAWIPAVRRLRGGDDPKY